jgi:PAS domain S-box-containing protein
MRSLRVYFLAIAVTVVAVSIRWFLDLFFEGLDPFETLPGAIAIIVFFWGYRPAVLGAVIGYLACIGLFVGPRGLARPGAEEWVSLALHITAAAIIIGFGEGFRRARLRAEALANARENELKISEERRRAAEHYAQVIERQREELRITLASIGDGVIATDSDGRITMVNHVAERLTGWASAEAIGRPLPEVFRLVNELTRQPVADPVAKVMAQRQVIDLANDVALLGRDGSARAIEDTAAPVKSAEGGLLGVVMVFRDVTERRKAERILRQSEAQKRAALRNALDCFFTVDREGRIVECNAAAERTFGYAREEFMGREMAGLLLAGSARDGYRRELARCVATGESPILNRRIEITAVRADGTAFPAELATTCISTDGARMTMIFMRDITGLKRHEQEMQERDQRKNEFLATLAHELRNPLAPIRNALEIISATSPSDPRFQWSQQVIHRQLDHMVRLLDDLLDVSRIIYGKLALRKQAVELSKIVREAVETVRSLIDETGQDLSIELPSAPIHLLADPTRLAQVIGNLLNNAAKYTPAGGHIWLRAEQRGDEVMVRVKDDGIGIAPEVLPRIFEIFSQAEPALQRARGGLGVGLSLVRGLVELHGGRIEARSEGPGKGSEFTVYLPLATPPREISRDAQTDNKREWVRRRVLVVDDVKDSADTIGVLLETMGHEVHETYDGKAAMIAAERLRPQVILLDIGMPEPDGYEVCRRIREQPWGRDMFIIALTGWAEEEARRRSGQSGFDGHLIKPVSADELEKLLADLRTTARATQSAE